MGGEQLILRVDTRCQALTVSDELMLQSGSHTRPFNDTLGSRIVSVVSLLLELMQSVDAVSGVGVCVCVSVCVGGRMFSVCH